MSGKDDEDRKPLKDNASPILKPPGLSPGGHAPRGSVGNRPSRREGDMVVGPLYLREGGKERGPFFLVDLDPHSLPEGGHSQPKAQGNPPPDNRYRFPETPDQGVNILYSKEADHVMVPASEGAKRPPAPERAKERGSGLSELYAAKAGKPVERKEKSPVLQALYASKSEGKAPTVERSPAHQRGQEHRAQFKRDEPDRGER